MGRKQTISEDKAGRTRRYKAFKSALAKKNMTAAQLAEKANINVFSVQAHITGKVDLGVKDIIAMAKVLDCEPVELGGTMYVEMIAQTTGNEAKEQVEESVPVPDQQREATEYNENTAKLPADDRTAFQGGIDAICKLLGGYASDKGISESYEAILSILAKPGNHVAYAAVQ